MPKKIKIVVIFQMGKTQSSRHLLCNDPKTMNTRVYIFPGFMSSILFRSCFVHKGSWRVLWEKKNIIGYATVTVLFSYGRFHDFFCNLILIVVQIISDTDDKTTSDSFYKRKLFIYFYRCSVDTVFDRLQHF